MTQPGDAGDAADAADAADGPVSREGGPDPAAELARRRREVVKALHPDVGGDPEAFVAAMRALDDEGAAGRASAARTQGPDGFASPARGPAVRVTWRGRLRRARRKAARTVSRRRFIDVPRR
ncbi:hypothetical protein KLP28_11880 [Nocardioidaceae bacterium]|nr:hypothetical protein KLP28_11880 [Nocardioidaceae bacterium]